MYATCETVDCFNELQPILVTAEYEVICGVCSAVVSNISNIQPEAGKELPAWILEALAAQNSTN